MFDTFRIEDKSSLDEWIDVLRASYFSNTTPPVQSDFAALSQSKNRKISLEINRLRNVCGCNQAAAAFFLSVAIATAVLSSDGIPLSAMAARGWATTVALIIGATLLTKLGTLLLAHRQLLSMAEQLAEELRENTVQAI